jgi:hypothetical protein
MKKILLFNAFLLLTFFGAYGQFQNTLSPTGALSTYDCDHYSIETAGEDAPFAYAIAGTFFDGSNTKLHILTLDGAGSLIWEKHLDLGATNCRALDVAIGKNSKVAITGFVENGGTTELYAALYDGSTGNLLSDYQYTPTVGSATGNNIIYSTIHDNYIIGGFETTGADGNGLLIALDGGFSQVWAKTYDSQCEGFNMTLINEIVEVNGDYFITGKLSNASNPSLTGKSQVLAAMVRNSDGTITDNESFRATNSINQEAMGVSAYFNRDGEELVLLYNVSNSPTVDENRPYVARYRVVGTSLLFDVGFRINDTFSIPSYGFSSNPNFTGLKIVRNDAENTYIMFGMIDAYGQGDDHVISVYQEFDLTGSLIGTAKLWSQSEILMGAGFSTQGGTYAIHNPLTLNTDLYTPETTSLSADLANFVSVLPSHNATFTLEIISSTLNTAFADSPCIDDFELEMESHSIVSNHCLDVSDATGSDAAPVNTPITIVSVLDPTCLIFNSPAMGNSEFEMDAANELMLFANPAHDVLNFTITEAGTYNAVIINMDGRVLLSNTIANTASQNEIDIANLATGLYILRVTNDNGQSLQQQFVKK